MLACLSVSTVPARQAQIVRTPSKAVTSALAQVFGKETSTVSNHNIHSSRRDVEDGLGSTDSTRCCSRHCMWFCPESVPLSSFWACDEMVSPHGCGFIVELALFDSAWMSFCLLEGTCSGFCLFVLGFAGRVSSPKPFFLQFFLHWLCRLTFVCGTVEELVQCFEGLLEAHVSMFPKLEGDATLSGQSSSWRTPGCLQVVGFCAAAKNLLERFRAWVPKSVCVQR